MIAITVATSCLLWFSYLPHSIIRCLMVCTPPENLQARSCSSLFLQLATSVPVLALITSLLLQAPACQSTFSSLRFLLYQFRVDFLFSSFTTHPTLMCLYHLFICTVVSYIILWLFLQCDFTLQKLGPALWIFVVWLYTTKTMGCIMNKLECKVQVEPPKFGNFWIWGLLDDVEFQTTGGPYISTLKHCA